VPPRCGDSTRPSAEPSRTNKPRGTRVKTDSPSLPSSSHSIPSSLSQDAESHFSTEDVVWFAVRLNNRLPGSIFSDEYDYFLPYIYSKANVIVEGRLGKQREMHRGMGLSRRSKSAVVYKARATT
jgi:hypothetical protein